MIEKTGRTREEESYAGWTERKLNERIMALYEEIEGATLANLEVARKNSQLEIQIETIDEVIRNHPQRTTRSFPVPTSNDANPYSALLSEHLALADRVTRIEEMLAGGEKKGGDNQHTLHKITSIQDLARRKATVEKTRKVTETRREDTARKSRYA